MFLNFGDDSAKLAQKYMTQLRLLGMSVELYPDKTKINKQMSYANKRGTRFVIMLGELEIQKNKLTIKNMEDGSQDLLSFEELTKNLEISGKRI